MSVFVSLMLHQQNLSRIGKPRSGQLQNLMTWLETLVTLLSKSLYLLVSFDEGSICYAEISAGFTYWWTGMETIENVPPIDDDPTEPTMGEKLERLSLLHDGKTTRDGQHEAPSAEQPRADSVVVLLKQALRADDRALLLDCLYNRNEKVIANSIALLNPSDVLKLLQYLASITDSRGAVLVCALPWLRSLLLQHASAIMSQESSLTALNSLYQLIEARVATFHSAVKLSGTLDLLFSGVIDEGEDDEVEPMQPVIYEDKDTDEEEEEEEEEADAMETEEEENREDGSDGELDEIDAEEL
ncbi:hypothetical protein MLD38_030166 [Melastoma candidum]|uniref:Uncharacterized protein n=1 Tax=Melastoma candidum TaxID=119954 RepID=A0ACB9MPF1_9MYRT|nr:hypothetical protein MLD38_030166 [Melastoma candidum]